MPLHSLLIGNSTLGKSSSQAQQQAQAVGGPYSCYGGGHSWHTHKNRAHVIRLAPHPAGPTSARASMESEMVGKDSALILK
ncbi:Hypothetical protein FKW44_018772 [Caligus rogercresseyi]|uniref:Uncharacterized protein n=1 Tax=Caligus rogercresseyi TaxID=217165 RepID=A0A7T8GVC3_CALRO|nr:Hypothetical protein FKW44_018772 [Caligus rogercresseyi]